jgi:hypothetical protein
MLTPRQKQLYVFLCSEAREGRRPTFQQMADALGQSRRWNAFAVYRQLKSRVPMPVPVFWNPSLEKMEVGSNG